MAKFLVGLAVLVPVARGIVCSSFDSDQEGCENAGCVSDGICWWTSWSGRCEADQLTHPCGYTAPPAPSPRPTAEPSALPTPSPTMLSELASKPPTIGCEDGESPYQLGLYDAAGDGWEGATYTLTSEGTVVETGTLATGTEGVDRFCLLDGSYYFAFGGGADDAEISVRFLQLATSISGPAAFTFVAAAGRVDMDGASGGGGSGGGGSADAASAGGYAAGALAVFFVGIGVWWFLRSRRLKAGAEATEEECAACLDVRSKLWGDQGHWANTEAKPMSVAPTPSEFSAIEAALGSSV